MSNGPDTAPLALWGGLECTVNRVGERYFDQVERSGHLRRDNDLQRFAGLGIRALRYPVLWERIAPEGLQRADWSWPDARLAQLRQLGVTPIAGLVHHGSGPRHTSLVDPHFADGLAQFAGAVAQRYPWLDYYTPVNEPLTTARFCGLYGVWYPHGRDDAIFVRALLNQCRGVILSMRAIRAVNPRAKLVQTDDLGVTRSTPELAKWCAFYNERRWLGWDLLCGLVDQRHPLRPYLLKHGIGVAELDWFLAHRCPPDIVGINYYVTSDRWLDHRAERYPPRYVGAPGFADIEAVRALAAAPAGVGPLLDEAWQRYGLPLAITETHIDARREDQLRWLSETWQAAQAARRRSVDVRAVTGWALLGSFDWNCLVTEAHGYYESGAFDLRSGQPRPTAVAALMRALASGQAPAVPGLAGTGWWRRAARFACPPVPATRPDEAPAWQYAPALRAATRAEATEATAATGATEHAEHTEHTEHTEHAEHTKLAEPAEPAEPVGIGQTARDAAPWNTAGSAQPSATGTARLDGAAPEPRVIAQAWPGQAQAPQPGQAPAAAAAAAPILIVGGGGALARAFAHHCAERDLACVLLDRKQLDSADRGAVDAAILRHRPWAVVNAAGYLALGEAARDAARCVRDNVLAPAVLAAACASHGLRLLTFSSERVFDGSKTGAYIESDPVAPADDFGKNKADAEQRVLAALPRALVVRSGVMFGPWGPHHDIVHARRDHGGGWPGALLDRRFSPTYVNDLVHSCLDLLIDDAQGLWHLSHGEALTLAELRARYHGSEPGQAEAHSGAAINGYRPRTAGALGSERGALLAPLANALRRYRNDGPPAQAAS